MFQIWLGLTLTLDDTVEYFDITAAYRFKPIPSGGTKVYFRGAKEPIWVKQDVKAIRDQINEARKKMPPMIALQQNAQMIQLLGGLGMMLDEFLKTAKKPGLILP